MNASQKIPERVPHSIPPSQSQKRGNGYQALRLCRGRVSVHVWCSQLWKEMAQNFSHHLAHWQRIPRDAKICGESPFCQRLRRTGRQAHWRLCPNPHKRPRTKTTTSAGGWGRQKVVPKHIKSHSCQVLRKSKKSVNLLLVCCDQNFIPSSSVDCWLKRTQKSLIWFCQIMLEFKSFTK